ncbi:BrnT family toxin [Tardibacter chloracetimidivorans]|uniref:BrnT family toxin n=1 Tax=Tardibacter chloracetimidivorans TaxID=1921510 RepID=UPI0009FA266D|nr:BrnT family toxin [Tardibacter chloracetimidivorans]
MIFEWDDDKAAANLRKHHVAFELAELVWDDPAHIIVFDRYENDEERWHAIGLVRGILILTVVHTLPTGDDENVPIRLTHTPTTSSGCLVARA